MRLFENNVVKRVSTVGTNVATERLLDVVLLIGNGLAQPVASLRVLRTIRQGPEHTHNGLRRLYPLSVIGLFLCGNPRN